MTSNSAVKVSPRGTSAAARTIVARSAPCDGCLFENSKTPTAAIPPKVRANATMIIV